MAITAEEVTLAGAVFALGGVILSNLWNLRAVKSQTESLHKLEAEKAEYSHWSWKRERRQEVDVSFLASGQQVLEVAEKVKVEHPRRDLDEHARHAAMDAELGRFLTSSNDATVRLWQIPQGAIHAVLTGHIGWVRSCAFSPDGALLGSGGHDRTARLWDVANGTGHAEHVDSCAFSPDGTLLATTSDDRTVRPWQLPDGATQAVLTGHTDAINGVRYPRTVLCSQRQAMTAPSDPGGSPTALPKQY